MAVDNVLTPPITQDCGGTDGRFFHSQRHGAYVFWRLWTSAAAPEHSSAVKILCTGPFKTFVVKLLIFQSESISPQNCGFVWKIVHEIKPRAAIWTIAAKGTIPDSHRL
jgi:hypothetical protein